MDTAKSMLALLLERTWPLFPVFHRFLEVNPCSATRLEDKSCNNLFKGLKLVPVPLQNNT